MPLPNPRRTTVDNFVYNNGRLIGTSQTVLTSGRTGWTGNQRRRRNAKIMAPTALTTNVYERNTGTYTSGNPMKGIYRVGTLRYVDKTLPVVVKTAPSEHDERTAMMKAVSAFSKEAGLGVSLAETPSSLRLVGRRTTTVFQILTLAGKGKFRQAGDRLRAATGYNVSNRSIKRLEKRWSERKSYDSRRASSFWLEHQFGFVPLLQTIFDSISELERSETIRRRTGKSNGARYGMYAGVINTSQYTAARLGLLNPALVLWDKLPFSFVIDWFLPISTILRWLGSNRGLGKVYMWRSNQTVTTITVSGIHWETNIFYQRFRVFDPPTVGDIFNASSRSHGLWTVITSLALFNTLR